MFSSVENASAVGIDELRDRLSRLFARPHTYGWSELEPLHAGGPDELVWFVSPTRVVMKGGDGNEQLAPYRVREVLELAADGRWLFGLFDGSEPASQSD